MNLKLNAVTPEAKFINKRISFLLLAFFLLIGFSAVETRAENGKIVYASGNAIFKMNPDGTGVQPLTFNMGYNQDYSPVWSPDGTKIAFARSITEVVGSQDTDMPNTVTTYGIYTVDYNGGNLTQIKSGSPFINDLTWSPDGAKLAYVYGADTTYSGRLQSCSGNSYIYVVNAVAGGASRRFTVTSGGLDPSWSPDGTKIYYAVNNASENYGIYSVNVATNAVQRVTYDSVPPADPEISPDGTRIAYAVNYNVDQCLMGNMSTMGPTRMHVYRGSLLVYDIAQGSTLILTSNANTPAWHPSGSLILFISTGGSFGSDGGTGEPELATIEPTGINQTVIPNGETGESSGSWSP